MRFKESLGFKIASVIFSYIMAVILVVGVAFTVLMGAYKFYFSNVDTLKEEILSDMAERESYHISNLLDLGSNLKNYYKDKNVFYKVTLLDSEEAITNYSGEEYIASAQTGYYTYKETLVEYVDGQEYYETEEILSGQIEVFIAKEMHKNDLFSVMAKIIEIGHTLRYAMVFIALGALAAFIFLLCYLYCSAGHRTGGEIKRNHLDMVPFDFLTVVVAVLAFFSIQLVYELANDMTSGIIAVGFIGSVDYFVALGYTMSFATRVKTKTLIKNNIIFYVFSFLGRRMKKLFRWIGFVFANSSLLQKSWIVVLIYTVCMFVFTVCLVNNLYDAHEVFVLIMVLITVLVVLVILYLAVVLQKIKSGGERIAKGDLQHKIDTDYMVGDFKCFAESLNNINEGLQSEINERMKSEHFKTELITNVSHDIKTPLTSIINYVDLIKKEETDNETVKQYIEVLDRQSGKLKKLVEDLVEASKASTGNLKVNLSVCNVGLLITQTLGEFEDKLLNAGLKPVVTLSDDIKIMADARYLWRVFENLLSNICKYAQPQTRVYINLEEKEGNAYITLRNISKYELNISGEDLTQRFVRGDSSRNTEGSGLGLSIAKSLAELQNGEMFIDVDGDLFKVTIKFGVL